MSDSRLTALCAWLNSVLKTSDITPTPLVGDASFRRYFRLQMQGRSLIAMDAPPELENSQSFVNVAQCFSASGIRVPTIYATDLAQGFLLLEDLGDKLYLRELTADNADVLYQNALASLLQIHRCQEVSVHTLPHFDTAFIERELYAFQEWFLAKYLQVQLPQQVLTDAFAVLAASAAEQPQVCVHRDYHSRNLLVLEQNEVGVLDFQDAVWGPITYDAVSLLRDCYIAWPKERVYSWILNFYQCTCDAGLIANIPVDQFIRWFDLMGMQRHMKAIFIFARKYLRDSTPMYLADIPRALTYILDVSARYPEFATLRRHLLDQVMPRMEERI